MDLSAKEVERVKFVFSVYDFDSKNEMDGSFIGPALRALGLTPSLAYIAQLGGTTVKGQKVLSVEEFLPLYASAKKNKDVGTYEDYVECLRSNAKGGDGKISSDHLSHLLQAYGEKLDPEDIKEVIQDCGGNLEEGLLSYAPFLKNMMEGPDMESYSFEQPNALSASMNQKIEQLPTQQPPSLSDNNDKEPIPTLNMSNAKPMVVGSTSSTPTGEPSAAFTVKVPPKQRSQSVVDDPAIKPEAANAAFTLKTPSKGNKESDQDKKAAKAAKAAAELKPKNQQPLISMKTMAMIGNMSK